MLKVTQAHRALTLRRMHLSRPMLVLPNAWDVASARIFEEAGARAIGTSSAAIAFSLGFPDGEHLPRSLMLDVIARIAASVEVPVTADIEGGYAVSLEELAGTIGGVIGAGAVGINIEDASHDNSGGLLPVDLQLNRLRVVRDVGRALGVALVVNARTDAMLSDPASEAALEEAVTRAAAYIQAGADCIFVPFVSDADIISRLARRIAAPLNVLAAPGIPAPRQLEEMGVARLSTGSRPFLAALSFAKQMAISLLNEGRFESLFGASISYADANALFSGRHPGPA